MANKLVGQHGNAYIKIESIAVRATGLLVLVCGLAFGEHGLPLCKDSWDSYEVQSECRDSVLGSCACFWLEELLFWVL